MTTSTSPLVWITGASSGIGWALALRYHQAGWRLALVARRADQIRVRCVEAGIDLTAPNLHAIYEADVRDRAQILAAARRCIRHQGLPDVAIANAGISVGVDTSIECDLDVLEEVYATNVFGLAASLHPFIDPMRRRRRGLLVGVASVAAARGLPGHAAYCGSKAAVVAHLDSLRSELHATGVKVVTLVPGYVATDLTARNPYPMPFLLSAEAFAERAFASLQRGGHWWVIPWPMAWVFRALRCLPDRWLDAVFARQPRKPRRET